MLISTRPSRRTAAKSQARRQVVIKLLSSNEQAIELPQSCTAAHSSTQIPRHAESSTRPLLQLTRLHSASLGGSNLRMDDKFTSTQPLGDKQSLIIISGGYSATSMSIFFSDPSADYKYSDIGSGAAGYISSGNVFYFS
jgi:hypothetical protein